MNEQFFVWGEIYILYFSFQGQAYLGEHLKRSLSTSDIGVNPTKPFLNPQATLHEEEEEEEETDQEFFSKRLKEDRKYLSNGTTRRATARKFYLLTRRKTSFLC